MKKIIMLAIAGLVLFAVFASAGCTAENDANLPDEVCGIWYSGLNPADNSYLVTEIETSGSTVVNKWQVGEDGISTLVGPEYAVVSKNTDGTYTFTNTSAGGSAPFTISQDKQSLQVLGHGDNVLYRSASDAGLNIRT